MVRNGDGGLHDARFQRYFRLMSWVFFWALVMVPFCRPLMAAATARRRRHFHHLKRRIER